VTCRIWSSIAVQLKTVISVRISFWFVCATCGAINVGLTSIGTRMAKAVYYTISICASCTHHWCLIENCTTSSILLTNTIVQIISRITLSASFSVWTALHTICITSFTCLICGSDSAGPNTVSSVALWACLGTRIASYAICYSALNTSVSSLIPEISWVTGWAGSGSSANFTTRKTWLALSGQACV